jgi:hypothetical protein
MKDEYKLICKLDEFKKLCEVARLKAKEIGGVSMKEFSDAIVNSPPIVMDIIKMFYVWMKEKK